MFVAIIAALVLQLPGSDDRVVTEGRFEPTPSAADRAKAACGYRDPLLVCDPVELAHFQQAQRATTDAPAGIRATAVAIAGPSGCTVGSVHFTLRADDAPISIDWQRSTMDVDGVAVQAIPGFARRATSALIQRPSVAAAGVVLAEEAFADRACVAMLARGVPSTTVTTNLAVEVGGRAERVTLRQNIEWRHASEAEAVALLPVPPRPSLVLIPDEPAPFALIVGGSAAAVGFLGGSALGLPALLSERGSQAGWFAFAGTTACCGLTSAAGLGLAAGVPAYLVEYDAKSKVQAATAEAELAAARLREHNAYLAKRNQLGVTP